MQPLVSIVTPCYNGEEYLERFFNSILAQTYPNIELVFINDGSTDRTEDIVNSYSVRFQKKGIRFIYRTQENAGQAAALNNGLKLFSGEYMNWMDSDDVISPEFIEKRVEFLSSNPECAFCYGKTVFASEKDTGTIIKTIGKRDSTRRHGFFEDVLYVRNVFFPGYMVRTVCFDCVIPNREIYAGFGGQNAQLLLPLAWYYGEPGYVEDSIYTYYVREDSHSHSLNSSEKIIQQLERYERILIETMERIPDPDINKYITDVRRYYARHRFGNAVDTMNPELIRRYYRQLRQLRITRLHDTALYMKYTIKTCFKKTKKE